MRRNVMCCTVATRGLQCQMQRLLVLDPLSTPPYDKSCLHDRYLRLFREWVRCLRLPTNDHRHASYNRYRGRYITLRGHTSLTRICIERSYYWTIYSIVFKPNQQDATLHNGIYYYNALFQAVPPPIIRSSKLYTQHRVFFEL